MARAEKTTVQFTHAPTHPRTHAPTHPRTHAPTHPRTHAPTHPRTHAPTPTHPRTHPTTRMHTENRLTGALSCCPMTLECHLTVGSNSGTIHCIAKSSATELTGPPSNRSHTRDTNGGEAKKNLRQSTQAAYRRRDGTRELVEGQKQGSGPQTTQVTRTLYQSQAGNRVRCTTVWIHSTRLNLNEILHSAVENQCTHRIACMLPNEDGRVPDNWLQQMPRSLRGPVTIATGSRNSPPQLLMREVTSTGERGQLTSELSSYPTSKEWCPKVGSPTSKAPYGTLTVSRIQNTTMTL
jgi:hypothetical protein